MLLVRVAARLLCGAARRERRLFPPRLHCVSQRSVYLRADSSRDPSPHANLQFPHAISRPLLSSRRTVLQDVECRHQLDVEQ